MEGETKLNLKSGIKRLGLSVAVLGGASALALAPALSASATVYYQGSYTCSNASYYMKSKSYGYTQHIWSFERALFTYNATYEWNNGLSYQTERTSTPGVGDVTRVNSTRFNLDTALGAYSYQRGCQ